VEKAQILHLLGWCSLIYIVILALLSVLSLFARNWLYKLQSKWFSISEDQFNAINYALLGAFKFLLIMFFLVPHLVLRAL